MKNFIPGLFLVFLLGPGEAQAEIVRGPVLHASGHGNMTITWETVDTVVGEVAFGETGTESTVSESVAATHHVINLTDLEPGKLYRYAISGEAGAGGSFRAGAEGTFPYRFTVAGDTRTQSFYHRVVLDRVLAVRPDFHVNTGDLVESGEKSDEWDVFFWIEEDLLKQVPFLPVIGNHDKDANTFYDSVWCLPGLRDNPIYFSLRYGNGLFLVLDYSEIGDGSTEQDQWLTGELARALSDPGIVHIVPFYHIPPLSSGPHGNAENTHMLGWLHEQFKEAGVRVVFNGHDHTYERSYFDGITYVVAGGGGAPQSGSMEIDPPNPQEHSQVFTFEYSFVQIDVTDDRLVLSAYNMDGDRIDRIELP